MTDSPGARRARVEEAALVAVHREVEHGRVVLEHALRRGRARPPRSAGASRGGAAWRGLDLGAVAVVDVPVHDEHALDPEAARGLGRDRDVAEEREPHRAVALRVVPRRPHHRHAVAQPAAADLLGERDLAMGGKVNERRYLSERAQ